LTTRVVSLYSMGDDACRHSSLLSGVLESRVANTDGKLTPVQVEILKMVWDSTPAAAKFRQTLEYSLRLGGSQ
jgi:hypothetical protein